MYVIRDKKSGVYKYKREYPVELREAIGKRWFVCSLHTKEQAVCNRAFPKAHAEYEQIVEQYALHRYTVPRMMQIGLLPELKQHYPAFRPKHTLTLPDLLQAQRSIERKMQRAAEVAAEHGEDGQIFSSATGGYENAMQAATAYQSVLLRIETAISAAKGDNVLGSRVLASGVAPAAMIAPRNTFKPAAAPIGYGPKLSEAFELWKKRTNPTAKTISDWGYSVRRFTEMYGDMHVTSITRSMCRQFRDEWRILPVIKSSKTRAIPMKELLAMAKAGKLDMRNMPADRTVNKMLDGLRAVIQTVIDQEDVCAEMRNPVTGLSIKERRKRKRADFSKEDVATLFASPLYRGCKNRKARNVAGKELIRDALFWMPLIGLFSGARQEEIAQLHLSDIFEDHEIPHFSINANTNDRRVKNEESERLVPIHHELVKCGFLDYVREFRRQGQERLFPNLQRGNAEQRYAKRFSRAFNEYIDALGIKPPRDSGIIKDFHSFRHLFKTACLDAGIDRTSAHIIMGHSSGMTVGDSYGQFTLEMRNKNLQKVSFPYLDLSHLCVQTTASLAKQKKRLKLRRISRDN